MGYIKDLLTKALWAGLYGAIAELALTQTLSKTTLWVALATAAVRFVIVFATTIKDAITVVPASKAAFAKDKSWKSYL